MTPPGGPHPHVFARRTAHGLACECGAVREFLKAALLETDRLEADALRAELEAATKAIARENAGYVDAPPLKETGSANPVSMEKTPEERTAEAHPGDRPPHERCACADCLAWKRAQGAGTR